MALDSSHGQMVSMIWNIADDVLRDDLSDLLEHVEVNPYALRRAAPNEKNVLNAAGTVLSLNLPNMAGTGTDDDTRSQLDPIRANFNERWFSGWDVPANERRVKMSQVAREIVATSQYQSQIMGNPDRDEPFLRQIIDDQDYREVVNSKQLS